MTSQSIALYPGARINSFLDPHPGADDIDLRLERLDLRYYREESNDLAVSVERRATARVVLYVKTLPEESPSSHFRVLRSAVVLRGWTVAGEVHDDRGQWDPLHPESAWPDVERILRNGQAEGVLAVHQHHISMSTAAYKHVLKRVAAAGCFTELLWPEAEEPAG
ncbi:hypothetical protein [Streptomyces sp. NPDC056069]|uniref:hypothetical protein n=1 Tax=Streptomyces sp. NPDC056069 TaxID=3345702 RepID=UPI0035DB02AC